MTGVLVRSGKFRDDDLQRGSPGADHVIDDIRALPDLLDTLHRTSYFDLKKSPRGDV